MFEELRNKKVKMIVGTNSGISIGSCVSAVPGFLTIEGIFSEFDSDLVKIKSAKVYGPIPGETFLNFGKGLEYKASEENYETLYVNKSDIITTAILSE